MTADARRDLPGRCGDPTCDLHCTFPTCSPPARRDLARPQQPEEAREELIRVLESTFPEDRQADALLPVLARLEAAWRADEREKALRGVLYLVDPENGMAIDRLGSDRLFTERDILRAAADRGEGA